MRNIIPYVTLKKDNLLVFIRRPEEYGFWSVTGEIWENGRILACGSIHDEILKAFPALKPVVDLHLSEKDGLPMYYIENGWYWYQGMRGLREPYEDETREDCRDHLLDLWRLEEDSVLAEIVTEGGTWDKEGFTHFANSLRNYWKFQELDARNLVELVKANVP